MSGDREVFDPLRVITPPLVVVERTVLTAPPGALWILNQEDGVENEGFVAGFHRFNNSK